jgi:hypothetical protein
MSEIVYPFGPMDTNDFPLVIDDFTFDDVNQNDCVGKSCKNICYHFVEEAETNGVCFLTICIPCYNENVDELMKTISSIMNNIEFIKHKVCIYVISTCYNDNSNVSYLLLLSTNYFYFFFFIFFPPIP